MNDKLLKIQMELKAPKGQYNSFGKFHYRSCEDILEAVKPLLEKNKCTLTIDDELVNIGDRYYVRASAKLTDGDSVIENHAYAREAESKSGMDASQITGTASSYARKYALNGLFLIDDTKDADTDDFVKQTSEKKITDKQILLMREIAKEKGSTLDEEQIKTWTLKQANDFITNYYREKERKKKDE